MSERIWLKVLINQNALYFAMHLRETKDIVMGWYPIFVTQ
jgi:hypothetical protein